MQEVRKCVGNAGFPSLPCPVGKAREPFPERNTDLRDMPILGLLPHAPMLLSLLKGT